MSKRFEARRVHGSVGEIAGAKPLLFHPCLDCGTKVYRHNAKRCSSCAHKEKQTKNLERAKARHEMLKKRQVAAYNQMLSILGIREHNGDCA